MGLAQGAQGIAQAGGHGLGFDEECWCPARHHPGRAGPAPGRGGAHDAEGRAAGQEEGRQEAEEEEAQWQPIVGGLLV
eukprot:5897211-Heterocapsa_arctica.AAC.1